jgi:O-antigen ligase
LAAAVAIAWLALVRYRWLVPMLMVAGGLVVGLGIGSGFAARLVEGFLLQDPATRLRLAEYQNALAIIREFPVLGVGFGQAPAIDLQTGVSSIYLTIASRMGFVGLAAFVWAVAAVVVTTWRGARAGWATSRGELLLGLLAALLGMLAVGLLDHYFFNIEFSHMATLFWLIAGTALAIATEAETDPPTAGQAGRAQPESAPTGGLDRTSGYGP